MKTEPFYATLYFKQGVTMELFDSSKLNEKVNQHKIVLVTYYASWCKPCQKITTILNELALVKSNQIKVIAVNIDYNGNIALANKISVIPTVHYYKNGAIFLKESGLKTSEHIQKNVEVLMAI